MTECLVRNRSGIFHKFARFCVVTKKQKVEPVCALAETERENQKNISLFRYRASPEEIQGKC
jgi:hypothetical protein